MMSKMVLRLFILISLFYPLLGASTPISIVAAENFYGTLAEEIGGRYVEVSSILKNPNQDPHLFSASPKLAHRIANADLVIYNGLEYDAWIIPLLNTPNHRNRATIVVADLLAKSQDDNPHIWYDPALILDYVDTVLNYLKRRDPDHIAYYQMRFQQFQKHYQQLAQIIHRLRTRYAGFSIIATESVFGKMAQHLGLVMLATDFQQQVMNGNDPSIHQLKSFEIALKKREAKVLIYNLQVTNTLTYQMIRIAKKHRIPVVGVTEIQPLGVTYVQWMLQQLQALEKALESS